MLKEDSFFIKLNKVIEFARKSDLIFESRIFGTVVTSELISSDGVSIYSNSSTIHSFDFLLNQVIDFLNKYN